MVASRSSRRPKQQRLGDGDGGGRVVDVDIADRISQAFLDYSMSVIVGRALPDVRDGLKPVQRRILYAMWEAGLRPDRPYRKCASAVGDVMKKYHPHGDTSIYDALVRMGQDFTTRAPLIDGRGNFGSVDGDPPAAMRYTEARLSPIAMELLDAIDEDTVDLVPNYDGYEREPVVLPARFPNLLVNGAAGIAVGMATSIPPHNLGEVVAACLHLLGDPSATVDDLMAHVPAPDFPTGARIVAGAGIREAYETGRGAVTMEAVAAAETRAGGLPRIVVTELPYQVNKATLLERMAELVAAKKLDEVRDLRDESSRDGMRVVIELKRGEDPARTLGRLFALTDLRVNFNVNMVALVTPSPGDPPQPRTVGLRDALLAYLEHQRTVLTRRTTYRRDKAAARAHVLEGLLVALDHLDEVIALIRGAANADAARGQLMARYELTEIQATAILDMQLRRLAKLERKKIADEHRDLLRLIRDLERILKDPKALDALLATELRELADRHASPRRSRIVGAAAPAPDEPGAARSLAAADDGAVLEAQPVTLTVSAGGYLRSVPQRRTTAPNPHVRDAWVAVLRATTEDTVLVIDADGGGWRISLADLPVTTPRQRGTAVAQLLGTGPSVPIAGAVLLRPDVATVLAVSASGLVKRTDRTEYEGRTRAMVAAGVRDGDRLVAVLGVGEEDHVLLASSDGQVIRFAAGEARPMGRGAVGVAGLRVSTGASVVAATAVQADAVADVLTLAADGRAKRSPLDEYPVQGRGGKGVTSGVPELAWCGVAGDLHVPQADGAVVLRPEDVAAARRSARPLPALGAVTGPVAAERRDG